MLKWCKVLLGRKFSELLYLSDERISQVSFLALSGKAATLKEKHARLSKQENAHDKLSLTTRLARAVMFKKENLCSLKLTNSNLWVVSFRLKVAAISSAEGKGQNKMDGLSALKQRKELTWSNNILYKWSEKNYFTFASTCKWKQNQEKSSKDGEEVKRFHDVRRFRNRSQLWQVSSWCTLGLVPFIHQRKKKTRSQSLIMVELYSIYTCVSMFWFSFQQKESWK